MKTVSRTMKSLVSQCEYTVSNKSLYNIMLFYSPLGPVSTGMGNHIGVKLPVREIYLSGTNHSGQLSLVIPPWVGAVNTGQRAVMLCN